MQVFFASVCTFQVLLLFMMLHSYICCWKKPVSLDCFSAGFWEENPGGVGRVWHRQYFAQSVSALPSIPMPLSHMCSKYQKSNTQ